MLDHDSHQRLTKLIEDLTDKRRMDREPLLLRKLKALCKESDANIETCFELLLDRLKCPHAQVRLHAVALDHELFMRSRAFRQLMAQRFSRFLELAVGHRAENPLPGPQDVAIQLRELALESIEIWAERFGMLYRQVQLGHHYLKHTLNFQFPELRARAAAVEAETRAREARARQLAEEKYRRIQAEFPAFLQATSGLIAQLDRCFQLLQGQEPPAMHAVEKPGTAAGEGEEEWEDVSPAEDAAGEPDREGLAAYADQALPEELLGIEPWLQICVKDPAVIETLQGLHRELQGGTLATLQDWLRNLVKVDAGPVGSPTHAAKEQLLRSALELRSKLTHAGERFAEAERQLKAMPAPADPADHFGSNIVSSAASQIPKHTEQAQEPGKQTGVNSAEGQLRKPAQHGPHQPAAASAIADLFGSSDEDKADARTLPGSQEQNVSGLAAAQSPSRLRQTLLDKGGRNGAATQGNTSDATAQLAGQISHRAGILTKNWKHTGAAAAGTAAAEQGPRQRQQASAADDAWPVFDGPSTDDAQPDPLSGGSPLGNSGSPMGAASSPENPWPSFIGSDSEDDEPLGTRQQPTKRPPISVGASLAAAQDVAKAHPARTAPSADGKGRSGPKEGSLPKSVKEQLLKQAPVIPGGSHLSYWDSDKAGAMVDSRALEISNHWGPVDAQAELPAERLSELFGTVASYVTPSAQQASTAPTSIPRRRSEAIAARVSSSLPYLGSQAPATSRPAESRQAVARPAPAASRRTAQRAADRAHNDAVLSAAGTDEQVAQSLAQEEAQLQETQQAEKKGRGTKRKLTVRERLARKLLSGRSVGQAQEEQGAVEDEQIRDRTANAF